MRILIVEDEPKVASFVRQGLEEEGYQITWVMEGKRALEYALQEAFDLVLLDLRLPDISGLEVCRRLRLHDPALPILMLTALDAIEDRVEGLRAGADDYLPKPFAFEELLARIEALLRRAHVQTPSTQTYTDGPLTLNPLERTCTCRNEPLELTQKEFDLLAYFLARPGQALSRDEIHRDVWGLHFDRGTNLIDVYVGYLRRKLQHIGCGSRLQAIRGVGYKYIPAASQPDATTDA